LPINRVQGFLFLAAAAGNYAPVMECGRNRFQRALKIYQFARFRRVDHGKHDCERYFYRAICAEVA
jgi:hypothetical protein